MEKGRLIAYLKALFTVVVWGASFIATKVALRDALPITIVWLRFAIGVLILGLAVAYRKQLYLPKLKDLPYFALLGFIGITYHQWLQSTGLKTAAASTTAWIVASTPIFIAILGWLFLKEKLIWDAALGILMAAFGVLLVVSKGDLDAVLGGSFGTPGDKLILISAPNWAVFSVLSRRGLKDHRAATMMFYVMSFGWLFSSVQFFAGSGLSDVTNLTRNGWLGVVFLGIACSGLAYIFWYDALQALPATQVGVFLYLEPLVAVVVSAAILSEAVTLASLVGGVVILVGVWIVNRPRKLST
ncbi:MAG: DMT family transporter [Anaerolineales bacterium]|nr:DMT family transporter [Anaerolineales bacterium]